jgi:S-adenosylmethionine synthetase
MSYYFTSESVSEGHPDKVADQISDAVLDAILASEPNAKVACETFVTTGLVVVGGEIKIQPETKSKLDINQIVRNTITQIGYTKSEYQFDAVSCGIMNCLHEQSSDINQGVERVGGDENQGAGDQGMMFGYATNETENFMPLTLDLSHKILMELSKIRKEGKVMTYLRPDAKSQVTIEYDDVSNKPIKIDTIVLSTQHDDFDTESNMLTKIKEDVIEFLMPKVMEGLSPEIKALFNSDIKYHINPTGKFVIGGPHGDTGLTGRKIIVDTYGGKGAHGGGAFSGKDPSKVDRSAAYACRHIAKNMVAAGVCEQVLVQVAYAIGVAEPVGLYVNTYNTSKAKDSEGNLLTDGQIATKISKLFDMKPGVIINRLKLKNPIYLASAAYGHMGRNHEIRNVTYNGVERAVELFTWEKLDQVNNIKSEFGL